MDKNRRDWPMWLKIAVIGYGCWRVPFDLARLAGLGDSGAFACGFVGFLGLGFWFVWSELLDR
jgi:hypothetical protein